MTGLLIALAACGIACAAALHAAFARTRPDLLLAVARPTHSAESEESRLTAHLLNGVIDAEQYRAALARLAAADVPALVAR
jgi:hypothetical protein